MPYQEIESDSTYHAVQAMAKLIPSVATVIGRLEVEWEPDLPPTTVALAEIARHIAATVKQIPHTELENLFRCAESLITDPGSVGDAVATGFFEALLAESSEGLLDFNQIDHLIGPKSREYCHGWDDFTGVKTEGLS